MSFKDVVVKLLTENGTMNTYDLYMKTVSEFGRMSLDKWIMEIESLVRIGLVKVEDGFYSLGDD